MHTLFFHVVCDWVRVCVCVFILDSHFSIITTIFNGKIYYFVPPPLSVSIILQLIIIFAHNFIISIFRFARDRLWKIINFPLFNAIVIQSGYPMISTGHLRWSLLLNLNYAILRYARHARPHTIYVHFFHSRLFF